MRIVNKNAIVSAFNNWPLSQPYDHVIVDNFFLPEIAQGLAAEFPDSNSDAFNGNYNNALEIKRTCNTWDRFGPLTYQVIHFLNSPAWVDFLSFQTDSSTLYADPGLHGGGLHTHPPGGKLNVHKDYSLHPKLGLQRKYNLLVYLNPDYKTGWGGELGLWSDQNNQPGKLIKTIEPVFNRAVIFDTTQNSWHGLEVPNTFPAGQDRKSLALYYLTDPPPDADRRSRALFAPSVDQQGDPEVLELINRRSQVQGTDPQKWSRQ